MVCLGFEPGAAGWKAQMNPLSYGGTPHVRLLLKVDKQIGVTIYWPFLAFNKAQHFERVGKRLIGCKLPLVDGYLAVCLVLTLDARFIWSRVREPEKTFWYLDFECETNSFKSFPFSAHFFRFQKSLKPLASHVRAVARLESRGQALVDTDSHGRDVDGGEWGLIVEWRPLSQRSLTYLFGSGQTNKCVVN